MTSRALDKGERYTPEQISDFIIEIMNNLEDDLNSLNLDLDLWMTRAIDEHDKLLNFFKEKYELFIDDDINEGDIDEDEFSTPGQTIAGHDIITEDECIGMSGHIRGQILDTVTSLLDYLNDIPYSAIYGIVEIRNDSGKVIGWSACLGDTR